MTKYILKQIASHSCYHLMLLTNNSLYVKLKKIGKVNIIHIFNFYV